MTRPNRWDKKVLVQCTGCGTDVWCLIGQAARTDINHWCDDCRPEAYRELDRQSYARRMKDPEKRERRRQQQRDRYRARKEK